MLTASLAFRDALTRPYRLAAWVEVWRGGTRLETALEYTDGAVRASLASRVTRTCSLSCPGALFPSDVSGLLTPFGNELRAFRGVDFGTGRMEVFPVFVGRIQSVTWQDDDSVRVEAIDRAGDILDANFDHPRLSGTGARVIDKFEELVREVDPTATFGAYDVPNAVLPVLSWEESRADALDDLADAVGGLWFCEADGSYVIRRQPWTVDTVPVVTLSDGPGGLIQTCSVSYDRADVFNAITVSAERTDGSPPVFYTSRDINPLSVTYFKGAFGLRSQQHRVQGAVNKAALKVIGDSMLRRSISLSETWGVTCRPDPTLELGDVARIVCKGRRTTQVIEGLTMPLTAKGSMPLDLRAMKPEGEVLV